MIGDTEAPLQLPFAPKPFRGELFSSWLLRLAGANFVPLDELLSGLQARYPSAPYALSLDVDLDEGFLLSMARFSRISVRTLRRLSLEKQIPFPKATVLLRFNCNAGASQLLCRRLGYAFCPQCIARQSSVHVPWEWALACLLHCSVHGIPLCVGCPSCGELDPLPFGAIPVAGRVPCQSCDATLSEDLAPKGRLTSHTILELERGYRTALLGASPRIAMLHGASGEQFRKFVDDTTRLVINAMDEEPAARLDAHQPSLGASRHKLIGTVWQLVVNGSTDCDIYERRARYRRGFTLWKSLLIPLLPEGRRSLARASRAWPSPLQRRLTAALSNSSLRD
jgi:hypothetical protein